MATEEVRVLKKDLPAPESGVHINPLLHNQGARAERRRVNEGLVGLSFGRRRTRSAAAAKSYGYAHG